MITSCIIQCLVLYVLIIYVCNRQLKVVLTNVLWTDLGRKFRKTLPRNDANLCDANKVQSDSLPSTSVDSLETCQKLELLHQSLNLSKRYVVQYWFCSTYHIWNSRSPIILKLLRLLGRIFKRSAYTGVPHLKANFKADNLTLQN